MGMFVSPEIGALDYLRFLTAATVGNLVGGSISVALLKYGHVRQSESPGPTDESVKRSYD
ncbi:formate/nitrite transporter [Halogeometricum pallidum JCM 14848]|uniref:Formate/nitrite transporter n=2 Tax=Halogeometricum TaxID=60846 RepID=M0DAD5_HALPD|nr:formate/nitrite transporter [Halogeometricum pallidum JCM 14848]